MDPFEVRVRFTNHLKLPNAYLATAQKAAQFALKHKDMHEDLHSCILEQLAENKNFNIRANIMCFVEVLMDLADKEGQENYVRMLKRDMLQIVDLVAPDDGISAINIQLCRTMAKKIHGKGFLSDDTLGQIQDLLTTREVLAHERMAKLSFPEDFFGDPPSSILPTARIDKPLIEQRVEHDRERHKRLRENIWAVSEEEEIARMWEEVGDGLDEDQLRLMEEEAAMRFRDIGGCPKHGLSGLMRPRLNGGNDQHVDAPTRSS